MPSQRTIDRFEEETEAAATPAKTHNVDARLKAIVERIERLEEEKTSIATDIKEIYAEAKGSGFDIKALRTIIRIRKMDPNEYAEQDTILETYMKAMGMV